MERRIGLLGAALALAFASSTHAVEPGSAAPDCSFPATGDARALDLARFRGQVLWVDFWASWCDPCAASLPFLNQLDKDLSAQGLRILGVNLDEEPEEAAEFLAAHPVGFSQVADPTGTCPLSFGVDAMPSAYLVDRQGVVRHVHRGFRAGDAPALRRLVEELLAETPGAALVETPGAALAADEPGTPLDARD
jgi:thiol-disulfide isomerase/thioredoxin